MRTALHTISYSGSWGQAALSLEATVERAAALGFDGLMLAAKRPHASLLDMKSDARHVLRAKMQECGMGLECLAAYTNFTADAEHAEIPHREMQIYYVGDLCRLAAELGGRVVRIFTGYEHLALPYSRAWDLTVGAVKEYDLIAAAKKLASLTVHTTVADYIRLPRFRYQPEFVNYRRDNDYVQAVPVGDGIIDYENFLTALHENGFNGCVAYEMCSPLRDGGELKTLDLYARRFLEFMQPWRS